MNKSKVILITLIVILCVGLLVFAGVKVLGNKTVEDNTVRETYNELSETEKQTVKEQYQEFKDGNLNLLDPDTEIEVPDALKDKVVPPELIAPITDATKDNKCFK